VRFAEGAAFVRMNAMAIVGMSARSASMSEEERARTVDAIVADSATVLPPYSDGAALSFEMSTNLATARA
jgi:dihydrodipicolinate synthase/N-acetylneuraminate lyase